MICILSLTSNCFSYEDKILFDLILLTSYSVTDMDFQIKYSVFAVLSK